MSTNAEHGCLEVWYRDMVDLRKVWNAHGKFGMLNKYTQPYKNPEMFTKEEM